MRIIPVIVKSEIISVKGIEEFIGPKIKRPGKLPALVKY
jgi:hypothetical protein